MKKIKRRDFIKSIGVSLVGGSILASNVASSDVKTQFKWKMVTSWPKNFPGLGVGAENLAKIINQLSNNRIKVKVFGANELVPPLEVFDFVAGGGAELGHSGAYYWKGKSQACQFFSSVPFGMNAQEMNAWLYYGGGLKLWEKLYKKFNLIPRPAGNTGVQMGGWFNKKISSVLKSILSCAVQERVLLTVTAQKKKSRHIWGIIAVQKPFDTSGTEPIHKDSRWRERVH